MSSRSTLLDEIDILHYIGRFTRNYAFFSVFTAIVKKLFILKSSLWYQIKDIFSYYIIKRSCSIYIKFKYP